MAFTPVKIANRTSGAPGAGIFDREECMDLFIAQGQEIQLFLVTTTLGTTLGTITTDFERVTGGFAWKGSDGSFSTVVDVIPNAADPTQADISAIPSNDTWLIAIFGYKLPILVT
jgi:hypothetical protein